MLAFALSIVMLMLYRIYVVKEQPPEPKKAAQAVAATHYRPAGSAHSGAHHSTPASACSGGATGIQAQSPKTSWWKTSSTA